MDRNKVFKYIDILITLVILILEIFLNSIIMRFATSGPINFKDLSFPYYSMTVVGNANIFPILVLFITITLIILSILRLFKKTENARKKEIVLVLTVIVFNILPWIVGFQRFSWGVVIIELLFLLKLICFRYMH